jgi:hypothetical protein
MALLLKDAVFDGTLQLFQAANATFNYPDC